MNQLVSFRRFIQLNRWFWATNGRTYSLGLLALLLITSVVLGRVLTYQDFGVRVARNNVPYFLLLSLPTVMLLGTHLFSVLHNQWSALLYLMLPASRTEKFVLATAYLILFVLGYSALYVLLESLFFQAANHQLPASANPSAQYKSVLATSPDATLFSLIIVLLLAGITTLLSSLYFRQAVFVKSAALLLGIFLGLVFLYDYVMAAFFPALNVRHEEFFLIGDLYVSPKGDWNYGHSIKLPLPGFIRHVLPVLLLAALWITASIRFNEIER